MCLTPLGDRLLRHPSPILGRPRLVRLELSPPLGTHTHTVTHAYAEMSLYLYMCTHLEASHTCTYTEHSLTPLAREVLLGASFWPGHLCSLFAIHFMAVGAGSALERYPGSCTHTGLETLTVTSSQVNGLRISSLFSTRLWEKICWP